jgi:hypothetical protein
MKNIVLILFSFCLFYNSIIAQTDRKRSNPKFKNNITIKTTGGVKIVNAGLYYADSIQIAVPNNNTVALSQNVSLVLVLEKGTWLQKDGIVSIGASEKIVTNTGVVVLNNDDLFKNFTNISADDADYITLKAVITSMIKKIPYFVVHFTVWDKWGKGKITGSYRLRIKQGD